MLRAEEDDHFARYFLLEPVAAEDGYHRSRQILRRPALTASRYRRAALTHLPSPFAAIWRGITGSNRGMKPLVSPECTPRASANFVVAPSATCPIWIFISLRPISGSCSPGKSSGASASWGTTCARNEDTRAELSQQPLGDSLRKGNRQVKLKMFEWFAGSRSCQTACAATSGVSLVRREERESNPREI